MTPRNRRRQPRRIDISVIICSLMPHKLAPARNRPFLSVLASFLVIATVGCTPPPTPLDLVDVEVVSPSVERCNAHGEAFRRSAARADAVDRRATDEVALGTLLADAERTGDYSEVNELLSEHITAFRRSAATGTRAIDACSSVWDQEGIDAARERIELMEQTTHDVCVLYDILYSEHGFELDC